MSAPNDPGLHAPATGNYFYDLPEDIRRRIELLVFRRMVGYPKPRPPPSWRAKLAGARQIVPSGLERVKRQLSLVADSRRLRRLQQDRDWRSWTDVMLMLWNLALPPLHVTGPFKELLAERKERREEQEGRVPPCLAHRAARQLQALALAPWDSLKPAEHYRESWLRLRVDDDPSRYEDDEDCTAEVASLQELRHLWRKTRLRRWLKRQRLWW